MIAGCARSPALPEQVELHCRGSSRAPLRSRSRPSRTRHRRVARPIDPGRPRVVEDLEIERLESRPVVEVPQMGELVAERVHQARVLEGPTRGRMAKADLDRAVRVADPVAAAHPRALRGDRPVPEAEAARESLGVEIEPLDQPSCGIPIQVRASLPTQFAAVNGRSPSGNVPG